MFCSCLVAVPPYDEKSGARLCFDTKSNEPKDEDDKPDEDDMPVEDDMPDNTLKRKRESSM